MQSWNSVDGVPYGVPHGYGANLLMYNTEEFPTAPTSWDVVFDKSGDYAGKVTAYDSPIYIADAAVYLMAHNPDLGIENPYSLDEEQLAAAVDLLKQQRENIGEYWSDYLKEIQAFTTGDTVVGTSWQVIQNVLEARARRPQVVLPDEGTTGWSDTWMISSESENPNCAYAWLDYIASPEANAAATEYFGEAPSNEAACEFRSRVRARRSTPVTRSTPRRSGTGRRRSPSASTGAPTSSAPTTRHGPRPGRRSRAETARPWGGPQTGRPIPPLDTTGNE